MEWDNLIQILIASIMGISTYLSYKNIKENKETQKSILTNEIIKFESQILDDLFTKFEDAKQFILLNSTIDSIDEEFANKYFELYNYIASLRNQSKIDEDLFYSFFLTKFEKVYGLFMLYKDFNYRISNYEDLSKYYNSIGLSIKEFGYLNSKEE